MTKLTITKKQIQLSLDVLTGKKLYLAKSSIANDIENAIIRNEEEYINKYGHGYGTTEMFNLYAVESNLREKGYRMWGDK